MPRDAIGFYVHHHGRGHLERCRAVAEHLTDVTVLSSLPAEDWCDWVELPLDVGGPVADVTARGALHWAPVGHPGYTARMARIAAWVQRCRPSVVVVDVSVEVAAFIRLLGVPVVLFALPGHRQDAPHQWGYSLADRIVAPWPRALHRPGHLRPFEAKVAYTGAVSRLPGPWDPPPPSAPKRALLVAGAGGTSLADHVVERLRRDAPAWDLVPVGGDHGWSADIGQDLANCHLVLCHAGQGTLADVAAADRPAIVVPEDRPFDEQRVLAGVLARAGLATVRPSWADVTPRDLDDSVGRPGTWHRWEVRGAAQRVAAVIRSAAA